MRTPVDRQVGSTERTRQLLDVGQGAPGSNEMVALGPVECHAPAGPTHI